jgi:hypothetical protein
VILRHSSWNNWTLYRRWTRNNETVWQHASYYSAVYENIARAVFILSRSPLNMRMHFLSPIACYMSSKFILLHLASLKSHNTYTIPHVYNEPKGRNSNHTQAYTMHHYWALHTFMLFFCSCSFLWTLSCSSLKYLVGLQVSYSVGSSSLLSTLRMFLLRKKLHSPCATLRRTFEYKVASVHKHRAMNIYRDKQVNL